MSGEDDLKRYLERMEAAKPRTAGVLDRADPEHLAFEQLATEALAAANELANSLRRKHDGYIRAGAAAARAGDTATADAEYAKADLIKPERDHVQLLGFQLDRAIIAWLDKAADVAAAQAAVRGATADLKKTKDDFAKTADNLAALSKALDGVAGVVKAVQGLLGSPAGQAA